MKHKPMEEQVAQERHAIQYVDGRAREINALKQFLRTHKDDEFKVYHNTHDNCIWIKVEDRYETFNGIGKEKFLKIYNQVRNNLKEEEDENE